MWGIGIEVDEFSMYGKGILVTTPVWDLPEH